MKNFFLPVLGSILLCMTSCTTESDSDGFEFRLKMEASYNGDIATSKTIVNYANNKVESIVRHGNGFEIDATNMPNTTTSYTYDGYYVEEVYSQSSGNMAVSRRVNEIEYKDGQMIKYGNEEYTYQNNLLTERTDGRYKAVYEYSGDKITRITEYKIIQDLDEYEPRTKFEQEYEGENIHLNVFSYRGDDNWKHTSKIIKYYENGLCSMVETFRIDGAGNEELESYYKYFYNEFDHIIQTESKWGTEEPFISQTTLDYDEYGNLIERKNDYGRTVYQYEVGSSNIEDLQRPASAHSIIWTY